MTKTEYLKLDKRDVIEDAENQYDITIDTNNLDLIDTELKNQNNKNILQDENILELQTKHNEQDTTIIELQNKNIEQEKSIQELAERNKLLEANQKYNIVEGTEIIVNDSANMHAKLNITGNSYQATRSGKNLLESRYAAGHTLTASGITFTTNADGSITMNGTATAKAIYYFTTGTSIVGLNIPANQKYTLSKNNSNSNIVLEASFTKSDDTNVYIQCSTNESALIQRDEELTLRSVYVFIPNGVTVENETIYPQFELGEKTEYEQAGVIPSVKEASKIMNCGENINIFDKNNFSSLNAKFESSIISAASTERMIYFKCEKNENYTFQKLRGTKFIRFSVAETTELPTEGVTYQKLKNMNTTGNNHYTTSDTAEYLVFWYYCTGSDLTEQEVLNSIKIEKGLTQTGYSKYNCGCIDIKVSNDETEQIITIPLEERQRVMEGDYLADDGIHHKRKQIELDGTETYFIYTLNDYQWFGLNKENVKASTILCSHIKNYELIGNYIGITTHSTNNRIYLSISKEITTIEQLKEFLAQQKSDGTPLIVEYGLSTEEIEPYTEEQKQVWDKLNNLLLNKGYNYIHSTNEISPNMTLNYVQAIDILLKEQDNRIANIENILATTN